MYRLCICFVFEIAKTDKKKTAVSESERAKLRKFAPCERLFSVERFLVHQTKKEIAGQL